MLLTFWCITICILCTFLDYIICVIQNSYLLMDCCYRYIPLSRIKVPLSSGSRQAPSCSFLSLSSCDEILKAASSSLIRCKLGSVEAAAKVCFLPLVLFFLPYTLVIFVS